MYATIHKLRMHCPSNNQSILSLGNSGHIYNFHYNTMHMYEMMQSAIFAQLMLSLGVQPRKSFPLCVNTESFSLDN